MKYSKIIFILLSCSVVFPLAALAGDTTQKTSQKSDFQAKEAPYLHTREVSTRPVHLTEKYVSMMGPKSARGFQLHTDHESPYLWVRRLRVDTLDGQKNLDSSEFLCHAWITADMGDMGESKRTHPPLLLTISQGMEEMQFPDGFAAMFDNRTIPRVSFLTMAVNNGDPNIDKKIQFRATIDYLEDAAAKELGVKRLIPYMLHVFHKSTDVRGGGHQHGKDHLAKTSDKLDHWLVPHGKQVLRSEVDPADVPADGMVHFAKLHLHPYGRSITLWDKTEGREIWTANADNHPSRAFITKAENYSSTTGFPIYKDHQYELITTYDNPTDQDIDAMGVLRLYVHQPDLPLPNTYANANDNDNQ